MVDGEFLQISTELLPLIYVEAWFRCIVLTDSLHTLKDLFFWIILYMI